MHTAIRNYSTKLTSYNIDQTEVSRSATKSRYNYDGMDMIKAACLDLTPTHIIDNQSTGPADPQHAPHARATEVASSFFLESIFGQRSTS